MYPYAVQKTTFMVTFLLYKIQVVVSVQIFWIKIYIDIQYISGKFCCWFK